MQSVPDDAALAAVKASGATVISTLTDMLLLVWQRERLDDLWLQRLVPEPQLATAADPDASERMIKIIARQNSPARMPDFLVRLVTPWLYNEKTTDELLANAMVASMAMYDAGIPIVMGSDMGNWPLFVSLFHAVGSIREMELLEEALVGFLVERQLAALDVSERKSRPLGGNSGAGSGCVGQRPPGARHRRIDGAQQRPAEFTGRAIDRTQRQTREPPTTAV